MPKRPRRGAVKEAGARGGGHQGEGLERDLHRARAGPVPIMRSSVLSSRAG